MSSIINDQLPEELVKQILIKLPVKSLLRFSVVCKEWYKLVNQPKPVENSNQFLLCCYDGKDKYVFYTDKHGTFEEYHKAVEDNGILVPNTFPTMSGIICFSDYQQCVILCNPSIRRHLLLPKSNIGEDDYRFTFGAVVDHIKNDYKVLRTDNYGEMFEIFRVSTGAWERINCEESNIQFCLPKANQVDLKGKSYWIAVKLNGEVTIVSFDAHEESWGFIKGPSSLELENDDDTRWMDDMDVHLFLLGESLVLVHKDHVDFDEDHEDSDEDHEDSDEDHEDSNEDRADSNEDHEDPNEDRADSEEDYHEVFDEDDDVDNTGVTITYKIWKMEDSEGTSWKIMRRISFREWVWPLGFRGNGEFVWVGKTSKNFISTNLENCSRTFLGRFHALESICSCPNYVESTALFDITRKESQPPPL